MITLDHSGEGGGQGRPKKDLIIFQRSLIFTLMFRHKRKMSTSDQEKVAVIHGTSELHTASDANSFTKELFKIYEVFKKPIPILEIPR